MKFLVLMMWIPPHALAMAIPSSHGLSSIQGSSNLTTYTHSHRAHHKLTKARKRRDIGLYIVVVVVVVVLGASNLGLT